MFLKQFLTIDVFFGCIVSKSYNSNILEYNEPNTSSFKIQKVKIVAASFALTADSL